MVKWFARPIVHVTDVAASVAFYTEQLGFTKPWQYDEDGGPVVAQVERQACAVILSSQWPDKVGNGLIFISLDIQPDSYAAQVAALDALRTELEGKGVTVGESAWGYRVLVVTDLDGNQLYFNYPHPPDEP